MTAQEAERLKVGDRVQLGARTGIVEFVVSDVCVVKWDGRRDSAAYTREALEKQFKLSPSKAPASGKWWGRGRRPGPSREGTARTR
jgi:hypothetical protein